MSLNFTQHRTLMYNYIVKISIISSLSVINDITTELTFEKGIFEADQEPLTDEEDLINIWEKIIYIGLIAFLC